MRDRFVAVSTSAFLGVRQSEFKSICHTRTVLTNELVAFPNRDDLQVKGMKPGGGTDRPFLQAEAMAGLSGPGPRWRGSG
ncbi:hypothetical protein RKLH11_4049 [Rhodobacteraceae bacterium KLH11]|nr:hypothetical protein RKLH11_4049 [Rhodobacteraceae bacterium KLH11]